jgi:hypothetical protein
MSLPPGYEPDASEINWGCKQDRGFHVRSACKAEVGALKLKADRYRGSAIVPSWVDELALIREKNSKAQPIVLNKAISKL